MSVFKKLFNLIHDRLGTFIRYTFVAGVSFAFDLSLFALFSKIILKNLPDRIFMATVFARIISSVLNFLLNRNLVFKSDSSYIKSAVKYISLVIVQMFVSATSVSLICTKFGFEEVIVKFFVDVILFIINYCVQRLFIFNKKN